jgi:hypothetical protein
MMRTPLSLPGTNMTLVVYYFQAISKPNQSQCTKPHGPPPWSHLVQLQNHHLASWVPTFYLPIIDPPPMCFVGLPPLLCGKNGYNCSPPSLALLNKMARIGTDKPPEAILNRPEIKWSPLPTLCGGSGGQCEVAPLMAPKTITMWAHALLHHWEWFKVVECWRLGGVIGVGFGWGVGFNTLYLNQLQ